MFTELRKRILEDKEKEIANGYFHNLEHIKLLNIISDSDIEKQFWNTSRKTLKNCPKELDRAGTSRIDLFNWIYKSISHLFNGNDYIIFNVKNTNIIAKVMFEDFDKALEELINLSEEIKNNGAEECIDITFCNDNYFVNIWQGEYNYELYLQQIA
ncbi:MAG: hypothetical protein MR274_04950 [Clostridium sp.]|nr:hypothetical protein [Clostridium sp.]MDY3827495.1 hypothetical protein [Clostridium sp.]